MATTSVTPLAIRARGNFGVILGLSLVQTALLQAGLALFLSSPALGQIQPAQSYALNPYVSVLDGQWLGVRYASDGNVYFASSTHSGHHGAAFFKYDPRTQSVTMLAEDITTICGEDPQTNPQGKIHSDILEANGWIYFSTYFGTDLALYSTYTGSHVIGYQLSTGIFRDYGVILSNYTSYSAIGIDPVRNYLYVFLTGYGPGQVSYMFRIDIATGAKTNLGQVGGSASCFFMFVDQRGDVWFSVEYQNGVLQRIHGDTGLIDVYPNELPPLYLWNQPIVDPSALNQSLRGFMWIQPLDGNRAVFTLRYYGGMLYMFDSTKPIGSGQEFTNIQHIGYSDLGLALGNNRVYYYQRANRGCGHQGDGTPTNLCGPPPPDGVKDFHLLSVSLNPADNYAITDYGLLNDQNGRPLWRAPGMKTDGNNQVFLAGDWWTNANDPSYVDTLRWDYGPPETYTLLDRGEFFAVANTNLVSSPTFSLPTGTYPAGQQVSLATSTTGATIRYTTDGITSPSETVGTAYIAGNPITVNSTTTIKAIAYEAGMMDSVVSASTYTITLPQVVAPTFSVPAGSYTAAQQVALNTTTANATIHYTTDGITTPSETAGTTYVSGNPIAVNSTTTIQAIAFEAGMADSTVSSAVYTITTLGWYNTTWTNRRKITIDHTKVAGGANLASFPMLVSITDPELKTLVNGGKVGKSDGTDLVFTAGDGTTKLNFEFESYSATAGTVNAWVQIPTLSATADTMIYLYYGNASAVDQENKAGVWDSNYKGVWHLSEAAGNFGDSTLGANTGTATSVTRTTGEIAGGGLFDGASSYVSVGNQGNFIMTGAMTEELWLKKNGSGGLGYILHKYYDLNAPAYWISSSGDQLRVGITYGSGKFSQAIYTNAGWHDGNWHHVAMVFGGSTVSLYLDGALATSLAAGGASIADVGGAVTMGRFDAPNGYYFGGTLDEPRISNIARTAGWIATEFTNQKTPSLFYTVGVSETTGGALAQVAAPTFSVSAGTYSSGQSVTLSTTTANATIHYTTDGVTQPSETVGSTFTAGNPIAVNSTETILAMAYEAGMTDSMVSTALYTINLTQVVAPGFSVAAGTYGGTQMVSLTTTTAGATIHYTTDGVTQPSETVGSTFTAGNPITVSSTTTILAMAFKAGMADSGVVSALYTISAGTGGLGWYNTTWTNRRKITIDHTKVAGGANLASFPMLVSITDPELKTLVNGGKVGKSDGTDLVFTAGDGTTKLNFEFESYSATAGTVNAWVQIPTLSATADTMIYLYYGNASAVDQENKAGVWDSNYKGVWHLSEAAGNFGDSTLGANTGTATSVTRTTGEIAGGGLFDGASSYVSVGNQGNFIMTGAMTEELWLKKNGSGGLGYILHKYYDLNAPAYWISSSGDQLRVGITYGSGKFSQAIYTNAGWHDGNWHHVAMVFGGSTVSLYLDGALATSLAAGGASIADVGGAVTMGRFDAPNGYYFGGTLDEPRISNIARTAGWIATEFTNQKTPSLFYTVGVSETTGGALAQVAAPTFSVSAGTYSSGQSVTLSTTTANATIHYTTDGVTQPSETVGSTFTAGNPIAVNSTETILAMAYEAGMTDSMVSTALYTINLTQVVAPGFSVAAGTYGGTQMVSLTTTTAGATIHYTTDGVTQPTETAGSTFTAGSPITVSSTTTILAMAFKAGMADSGVVSALYTISAGTGGLGWYNTTWTNRRKITIDHTKVAGGANLASFPMLVSITDPELKTLVNGGKVGKSDGTDLVFTAGDGTTKLNYEFESYSATAGTVNAWVQIPTLSASADTMIYLYYGNASAVDQENKAGVWDSNYKGVWHLSEAAGNFGDSTVGANTGTATSVTRTTGEIAGGGLFDGATSYVSVGNAANFLATGAVTEEVWLKKNGSGGFGYILHKYYDLNAPAYWISSSGDQLRVGITYGPGKFSQAIYTNAGWHDGNWHHVAMVFGGSTVSLYLDGALATSLGAGGASIADVGGAVTIGRFDGPNGFYFGGTLDEPRISNIARTVGWIATEFTNQKTPGSFYTVGVSESTP